ncbi:D-aminoacyl-tRNA deacylase [Sedimentibacter sp.]|uniref:D-aminoacyl-tRNA deacylase n=1 Tax=Sedimentibacter sp. TaxID=1960295 RepID=UPI0028AA9AFB|nr:D-aminoacyl-tRNA deacylase [Sedimentibacter sp.]
MISGKKAVYYICNEEKRQGLVSSMVWEILSEKGMFAPADITFDGRKVMMHKDARENIYYFVPTEVPVCWDYTKYLPEMNKYFDDCDMAGMVTWHEGGSAPPKVLTVHSIGDVNSGVYGPINPEYMRNLLLALERNRIELKLDEYKTVTEATHWSGTAVTGSSPQLILQYPVPMVDIEVGSVEESWTDCTACTALANALTEVFNGDGKNIHNVLCVGGVHFDPNFADAVFAEWDGEAFGISHIIANQWLVSGEYEGEQGLDFAANAAEAIKGGIEIIAFHDKMKGCYKDLVRSLGEKYNVPILKHQRLRNPKDIESLFMF